jgi:hypothetical protein
LPETGIPQDNPDLDLGDVNAPRVSHSSSRMTLAKASNPEPLAGASSR